jgi:hypothetical protein
MVILGFGLRALVAPGGGRGYGQQATATLITANLTSHGHALRAALGRIRRMGCAVDMIGLPFLAKKSWAGVIYSPALYVIDGIDRRTTWSR